MVEKVDLAVRDALAEALCVGAATNPCTVRTDTLAASLTGLPASITRKLDDAKGIENDPEVKAALQRLVDRLATDSRLPKAVEPIQEALKGFDPNGEIEKELDKLRSRLEERYVTPAVGPLLEALGAKTLDEAPVRIEALAGMLSGDALLKNPAAFLRQLGEFLAPVSALLARLDASARIGQVVAACNNLRQSLSRTVDALLPSADDVEKLAQCIGRLPASTGSSACTVNASITFSGAALQALKILQEAQQTASEPDRAAIGTPARRSSARQALSRRRSPAWPTSVASSRPRSPVAPRAALSPGPTSPPQCAASRVSEAPRARRHGVQLAGRAGARRARDRAPLGGQRCGQAEGRGSDRGAPRLGCRQRAHRRRRDGGQGARCARGGTIRP